jgi:hypothetical protein
VSHAQDNQVKTPAFDFSGVLYANWQSRSDSTAKAQNAGKGSNKFDVERVYLNFRMPAGERASIRVTTDVYNSVTVGGYYAGWTVRLKYAYLQWNFANDIGGSKGFNALARFGMLHTVVVDHEEGFWPRYLSLTDVERTGGFFSSADVGAAGLVTLPNKMGEFYATITNGTGYGTAENDRFKDFAARISLTPLANGTSLIKGLTISPYAYIGNTASQFQNGGAGQVGPVPDGLTKNRYGAFIGNKDPRLTFGLGYGQRTETTERGLNTAGSPRITTDVTGKLSSAFVIVRPGSWMDPKTTGKIALFGRLDSFQPVDSLDYKSQLTIFGASYDINSKVTFSLDYQALSRKDTPAGTLAQPAETKTLFLHSQIIF